MGRERNEGHPKVVGRQAFKNVVLGLSIKTGTRRVSPGAIQILTFTVINSRRPLSPKSSVSKLKQLIESGSLRDQLGRSQVISRVWKSFNFSLLGKRGEEKGYL